MSDKTITFELSEEDRRLLMDALGSHAWRYCEQDPATAARCAALAVDLSEPMPEEEVEPDTLRKPTTFSTIPPMFV